MENVDKKMNAKVTNIGVFDSGIGGFSVLSELIKAYPEARFFYYSDDAHAPYGPKSDEYITDRSFKITDELISKGAQMIVVACNTATASSIDALRSHYPQMTFVGVEPYLNAYYKETTPSKMAVLKVTKIMVDQLLKAMPMKVKASLMADYKAIKVMVEEL